MNKYLNLAHWALVIVVIISLLAVGQAGLSLWQTNKVNNFINNPAESENLPEDLKAHFAKAFIDAEQGKPTKALELLTNVVTTNDLDLEAAAYYNRGNIHLRDAIVLASGDTGRIALIGLAKQDYRNALLIDSSLWDARFNLEIALRLAPENAAENKRYLKRKGSTSVVAKVVGFRVDLP